MYSKSRHSGNRLHFNACRRSDSSLCRHQWLNVSRSLPSSWKTSSSVMLSTIMVCRFKSERRQQVTLLPPLSRLS